MINKKRTKQSGSAMVLTLIVLMVSFTMTCALLVVSQTSGRIAAKRTNSEAAFRLAEAGFHQAITCLKENSSYAGESNTGFGGGKITITVAPVPGFPSQNIITSTGTMNYAEGLKVSRTVTGMFDLGAPPGISSYSVVSKGPLSFRGNVSTSSSPKAGVGNVGSNTSVTLQGSVDIGGSATSAGSISIGGASRVSGSTSANSAPIPFPNLDYAALKTAASRNGITNGDVTVNSSGTTVLTGLINGNLRIGGSGHVVLKSPVYVTGTLTLTGGTIDGGTLITEKDISASGNTSFSSTGTLALVTLGNFSLAGGASVQAAVLVPNGTASMVGNSTIFGTLAANAVTFRGTPHITRNTGYVYPTELQPSSIGYYKE